MVRRRSTKDKTRSIFSNAFTSASTQQSVVADGVAEVGRLWAYAAANSGGRQKFIYRRDASFTVTAPQPVTQTRCEETVFGVLRDISDLTFPILAKPSCNGDNTACHVSPTSHKTTTNSTLIGETQDLLRFGNQPSLLWVEDDDARPEDSSAIVLAAFPKTNNDDVRLYRCTIDAKMANSTITTTRNLPKVVTGHAPEFKSVGTSNATWSHVALTSPWARLLDPMLVDGDTNMTVFAHTAATAGMWNDTLPADAYNYNFIVESILTLMATNGIARSTYNDSLTGTLKGPYDPTNPWKGGKWQSYMLPRYSLGFNGPQSIFTELDMETLNVSMFTIYARVNGYAWSSEGMIQKANMVVLIVYVFIACLHVIYSVPTETTSSAWDSVPEMVALALQSQRSFAMQNTGAGIDTIAPMKQKVRVRNVDGHLEYIFDDTYLNGSGVRANRKYE